MNALCLVKHNWQKYGTWGKEGRTRHTRWCKRCDAVQLSEVYTAEDPDTPIKWIKIDISKLTSIELKEYDNW